MNSWEEIRKEAKKDKEKRLELWRKHWRKVLKGEDVCHDQEIRAYIEKAVADIARKCGVDQSTVWAEMEYWSRSKA